MNGMIKKVIRMAMVGIVLMLFFTTATADVRLDVPVYDQKDKTWASDKLGDCSFTIGQQGCAISSTAMVFKYYGVDTDPQDMNKWLKKEGYYSGGCNIEWKNAYKKDADTLKWIGKNFIGIDQIKSELDNMVGEFK